MIPEWGNFALILACCLAIAQMVLPLAGAALGRNAWMAVARPAAAGQLAFLGIAFACLTYSFVMDDFSVSYVADNSSVALPWAYKVAGVWGGHEGSLLLWLLILAVWTEAVSVFGTALPRVYWARVIGVLGVISSGLLLFLLLTSNPFMREFPARLEGTDLNPLLQDPAMVLHPPMLYMGYVGFSVAFAMAVAGLLAGRLDAAWARWSRPWTVAAWSFLTVGIALGSWWAYYELGWGGWWFWDPVENASFMPWLAGTALIHSLAVTEKRGAFKAWTALLAIFTFSLSLLGTFLVRSGVLTSVHAFATDPERGVFLLILLALITGGALLLFAWRAPKLRNEVSFSWLSKETFLLINNVLLIVACAAVLLGTLYPLAFDALGLGKLSVGPPYFNSVFVPITLPLAFLIGLGPLVAWKRADAAALSRRLRGAFLMAVALSAGVTALILGVRHLVLAMAVFIAAWIMLSAGVGIISRVRTHEGISGIPRGFWGMHLAHVGIAVFMLGVGVVSTFHIEQDVRLAPGEEVTVGGLVFRLERLYPVAGPNFDATEALVTVFQSGEQVAELKPQKRIYRVGRQAMTQTSIAGGLSRDLLVALGEPLGDTAWSLRVYIKPMVRWIWAGAVLMALGGVLALSDRRYRALRGRAPPAKKLRAGVSG